MYQAIASGREGRVMPLKSTFTPPSFEDPSEVEAAHLMHDRMRRSDPKEVEIPRS
jgi:hypothetical protein